MGDPEIEERVRRLAAEIYDIRRKNLLKGSLGEEPSADDLAGEKSARKEIQSLGFYVTVESGFVSDNPEDVKVIVTVYKVKENLPPEYQKIYDEWFQKVAGIKI